MEPGFETAEFALLMQILRFTISPKLDSSKANVRHDLCSGPLLARVLVADTRPAVREALRL